MDYIACAVPFIGCLCFLLGIGFHAWCMREPRPKQEQQSEVQPEQEDKHSDLFRDIDEFLSGSSMSDH